MLSLAVVTNLRQLPNIESKALRVVGVKPLRLVYNKRCKLVQKLSCLIATLALSACGAAASLDLDETLSIGMIGVFEAPASAVGNSEPRSMKFTLTDITVVDADGNITELYEDDPQAFTVISRPQVIFETSMKDFVGKTLASVTATFDASVTVAGQTSNAHELTLRQTIVRFTDGLMISKAKSKRLDINVQWKDTIAFDADSNSETVTSPSLTFVLK